MVSGSLKGAWNNGQFFGDKELVDWATMCANAKVTTHVYGMDVICDRETPMGALAAMACRLPGRTLITEAPEDVLNAVAESFPGDLVDLESQHEDVDTDDVDMNDVATEDQEQSDV